ncbi:cupin domain-containing protein [Lyngbya confervoides]|uniref:Cupin domain-containing protein n=1 Tax=Lyngbya confervoides BDU141951 TaxID=1574623 RepID=A0ABD4T4K8_9CYAN|nr:cupin domain-containing protein [Lyngbya confervoides]MCM1983657.1 cupin domain-containing protein [Lyngbya confervoides BDU141951]
MRELPPDAQNFCFCELAPLYVLDLLNETERTWVADQAANNPELADELLEYQSAVTTLPYHEPLMPMRQNLKNDLFQRLNLPAPDLGARRTPSYSAIRSGDLNWQEHDVPGVRIAIVYSDETTRELVGFLKADPNVQYPYHRHAAVEELYMLEGDLIIGDEVFGAGDYIRSQPGSGHAPLTRGGCHFFFRTSMDDEYLLGLF